MPEVCLMGSKANRLAAEVRDEPEEDGESDADDNTGDDRKVERGVLAAMHDVAGKFSEAEWQFVPKIKKDADQNNKPT